jgi:hypothetical protein
MKEVIVIQFAFHNLRFCLILLASSSRYFTLQWLHQNSQKLSTMVVLVAHPDQLLVLHRPTLMRNVIQVHQPQILGKTPPPQGKPMIIQSLINSCTVLISHFLFPQFGEDSFIVHLAIQVYRVQL